MFGFAADEVGENAAPFFDRVHPETPGGFHAEVERVMTAPHGDVASFDYRMLISDRSGRFVRIRGKVAIDPADRRALKREHAFRETLAAEANHRIKDRLGIGSAMNRLEARALSDRAMTVAEARTALRSMEARINALSSVHGLM
jgi:hypothetical protein